MLLAVLTGSFFTLVPYDSGVWLRACTLQCEGTTKDQLGLERPTLVISDDT